MDPNMTLHELRELVGEVNQINDSGPPADGVEGLRRLQRRAQLATEIAEKFDALDGWMAKGGFTPDAWRETRDHR